MSIVTPWIAQIVHAALLLLAAPVMAGLMVFLRERLAGRDGSPILQPWRDLRRLLRKEPVLDEHGSIFLRAAPALSLTLAFVAAQLVPSFTLGMAMAPMADTLTLVSLLGLGRVVLILAVMDTGSGDGGVIAMRTTNLAVFADSAFLLALLGLSLVLGGGNLDFLLDSLRESGWSVGVGAELAIATLALAVWAETAAVPLDHAFSARDLAAVRLAEDIGRLTRLTLATVLICPAGIAPPEADMLSWIIGLTAWSVRLLVGALVVAGIGVLAGPPRPRLVLPMAVLLAGLALVLALSSMAPA